MNSNCSRISETRNLIDQSQIEEIRMNKYDLKLWKLKLVTVIVSLLAAIIGLIGVILN